MTLQIEYSCTEVEMKEAQAFHLRQHYGRGSQWRARLVIFGLVAIAIGVEALRFFTEIAPRDRVRFLLLLLLVFAIVIPALRILKRLTRHRTRPLVRLEASEHQVVFTTEHGRNAIQWSAFGQCIESPNLFVLLDRPKRVLFAVPKRAFPDEAARNWFRAQATQPQSVAAGASDATLTPGRFVTGGGVGLTLRLNYRDCVDRTITSWRTKGMILFVFALMAVILLIQPTPPDAVNSRSKTILIMLPILVGIMLVVIPAVAFLSWRSEKKHLAPTQIVLSGDGIAYTSQDGTGQVAWSALKYYLEGHWSFYVWNPRGLVWFMFPKRAFAAPSDLAQCRALLQANLMPSRWFFM
jgi:hypothetical protein